jgi:aspartate carbamoyltransferase catalytic subunit
VQTADVIYQTRIAKEWIKNVADFDALKGRYVITRQMADSMKKGAIIIHPLPRVDEITPEVDESPHAAYFKQVGYGLVVRMAVLKTILGA